MTVDEEVVAEIKLAMRTVKAMSGDGPNKPSCAWPEYWNTELENWMVAPFAENETRVRVSNADIARMDRCMKYLYRLTPDERLIVSGRAVDASWRAIMRIRRSKTNSHGYHKEVWKRGIWRIMGWMREDRKNRFAPTPHICHNSG